MPFRKYITLWGYFLNFEYKWGKTSQKSQNSFRVPMVQMKVNVYNIKFPQCPISISMNLNSIFQNIFKNIWHVYYHFFSPKYPSAPLWAVMMRVPLLGGQTQGRGRKEYSRWQYLHVRTLSGVRVFCGRRLICHWKASDYI